MSDEYRKLEQIHSRLEEIKQAISNLRPTNSALFGIFIGVWVAANWSGSKLDRWTDRVWYSAHYSATWKNVNVEKRPLDCDFLHAPIGDKGCHYKKDTVVFDDEKRRALLQQINLTAEERSGYVNTPNSVTLYWVKVPE